MNLACRAACGRVTGVFRGGVRWRFTAPCGIRCEACARGAGLAAGTPVVAYEGGGVASIITHETGILTERDPSALGRAIRALLTDPERLEAMARKGRRRAVGNFSWGKLGRRLKDWLMEISSQ